MKPTAGPATRDWEIFLRKSTARVGGGERARLVPQLRRLRVPAQPTQTTPSLPAAVSSGNLPNACAQSPANRDESPATPEACAFIFADLKNFHGIDVHALRPKTKLDEFWKPIPDRTAGLEPADLFAHFCANKLRLEEPDGDKIRARFREAKARLQSLGTRVEFNDRLIDQVVYPLYGLTENEIKLVERAGA